MTRTGFQVFVLLIIFSGAAASSSLEDCRIAEPQQKIDACTSIIESGSMSGSNLGIIYNNRGTGYYLQGEYHLAIRDYDRALSLNPADSLAYYNRGQSHNQLGEYTSAVADHTAAIRIDPSDGEFYSDRGLSYQCLGEFDRSLSDFENYFRLSGSARVRIWQQYLADVGLYNGAVDGDYGSGTRGAMRDWMTAYSCE